ncbi:MAG TPA: hypothetical protein VGP19_02615 [Candidatus Acidoferrales bacterium]|jgi:hypothetical protein|nr:hypothetical protein [Candidatus Acidoferrales bacterium]
MAKQIVKWSYWLGAVCAVLALLARALNVFGMHFLLFRTRGNAIGYTTFLDGALFLFVVSIATANYVGLNSRERQP